MASLALTSVLGSTELIVNFSMLHDETYDVLYFLNDRVRLSLQILNYLSKRFYTDARLKLAEEKIRLIASVTEYSMEEPNKLDDALFLKVLISKADDIELLSMDLLKILGPEFLNQDEELSYVVRSSNSSSYSVHHKFVYNYIKNTSSRYKKFKERLSRVVRTASPKTELVDFLISNSRSNLGLAGIGIGGFGSHREMRNVGRCIYTDSRMKNCFPIRAWVTVFYGDKVQNLVKGLLQSVMDCLQYTETEKMRLNEMSYAQLFECLYKHLEDHMYFIVIDNFDDSRIWVEISCLFPDKKNGSRILFTTKNYIWSGDSGLTSKINLFFPCFQWGPLLKMFHKLVFGKRGCPQELEIMVIEILSSCQFDLSAVLMVAKYLSRINQTTDTWQIVQQSIQNNVALFKNRYPGPGVIAALLKASEDIDSIHAEDTCVYFDECETKNDQAERFKHPNSSSEVAEANDFEHVGLEESLDQLVSELLQSSPQLEKIAIAGMAGIGKTTLAKRIFDNPSISYHFYIRAWVGISQSYRRRSLLIQLLQGITQLTDNEILDETDTQLEEKLYRCLKGQRYLIVMDDMWSIEAWNELKRTFPDDGMGSRILVTSRETNLIKGLNCKLVHQMSLLSDTKSWDLLQKKVFGQEICPHDGLAVIGKQIAERCEGLPLAIVVVSGILLKIGKTVDCWKVVADSVSLHVMGSENATRAIFSLSYEHLPDYLKSCFLYMGAFPGGYDIEVPVLMKLWIAEGFIVNDHLKWLEDISEEYLNDLVDRSLVLSGRRRSNGRLKTCRLHDLVLEFCVQEARKVKLLDVIKDFKVLDSEAMINGCHRFSFQCDSFEDVHLTASKSHAGSALFFGVPSHVVPDILLHYFDFQLLRVLDLISWRFDNFPTEQVAKLLLLRYLALTASFELPGILFKLQKLQTLIINGPWLMFSKIPKLPPEFWEATSLRHLHLREVNCLMPPEKSTNAKYLNSLQTLSYITLASCTHESFSCVPNILKLGVSETYEDFSEAGLWDSFFQNLVLLKHIQTLKISCFGHDRPLPLPSLDAFPKGLKNLSIRHSNLPWEAMSLIDDLPCLEVLKLRNNAFQGPKWETREGGFQCLKYLLIEETDLMHWEVESDHFPRLEQLVLKFCEVLEEIPTEIGDIPTLTHIKLENCCSSVARSAKDIQDEQCEYGHNINIQIRTQQTTSSDLLEETDG